MDEERTEQDSGKAEESPSFAMGSDSAIVKLLEKCEIAQSSILETVQEPNFYDSDVDAGV